MFYALQIFEWWYFRKYGTSFIEQVSLNHLSPWIGGGESNAAENTTTNSNNNNNQQSVPGKSRDKICVVADKIIHPLNIQVHTTL